MGNRTARKSSRSTSFALSLLALLTTSGAARPLNVDGYPPNTDVLDVPEILAQQGVPPDQLDLLDNDNEQVKSNRGLKDLSFLLDAPRGIGIYLVGGYPIGNSGRKLKFGHIEPGNGVSWEEFVCALSKGRSPFCREVESRSPRADPEDIIEEEDVELELEEEEAEKIGRKLQGSGDLPNVGPEIIKVLQGAYEEAEKIGRKLLQEDDVELELEEEEAEKIGRKLLQEDDVELELEEEEQKYEHLINQAFD